MTGPELVEAVDHDEWRRWLTRNHRRTGGGVWLVIHKKASTTGSLSYAQAVAEALSFGWIDSKANALDEERYKLWMAPRKSRSAWSAVNKRRVDELVASGAMRPSGMAAIEAAKADGSWSALDRSDMLELPDDLLDAFDRHAGSRGNWDGFPPSVRKQILEWIYAAKREATRAKRVEETASLAARNERAHQWQPRA